MPPQIARSLRASLVLLIIAAALVWSAREPEPAPTPAQQTSLPNPPSANHSADRVSHSVTWSWSDPARSAPSLSHSRSRL